MLKTGNKIQILNLKKNKSKKWPKSRKRKPAQITKGEKVEQKKNSQSWSRRESCTSKQNHEQELDKSEPRKKEN